MGLTKFGVDPVIPVREEERGKCSRFWSLKMGAREVKESVLCQRHYSKDCRVEFGVFPGEREKEKNLIKEGSFEVEREEGVRRCQGMLLEIKE